MEETTTLANPAEAEKALDILNARKPIPGMEHFDPSDIEVPYVKLIQGSSDVADGRPGQFLNAAGKVVDEISLILITYTKEEKVFEDQESGDKRAYEQYRFLCLDPITKWPVFLVARGTSMWPAKKYLNQFIQAGEPLWSQITTVASVKKENKQGKGKYFVMAFESMGDTDEAMKAYAWSFFDKMGRKMIQSTEAEDRDVTEERVNTDDVPEDL